ALPAGRPCGRRARRPRVRVQHAIAEPSRRVVVAGMAGARGRSPPSARRRTARPPVGPVRARGRGPAATLPPSMTALEHALSDALGPDDLVTGGDDLAYYGADRCRGDWPVAPKLVALPRTVEQVQAVVRACAAHGAAIVPSGGRTGLCGAATAARGEVVLALARMHRILEVDPAARLLRCEAGATVEAVHLAAAEHGLMYPVDFAAKGSAHIGGSIATNAGGVKVLRYGLTRSWVQGLGVVVASGEHLRLGGALVKDNTGYDLRQLFIGAEGTLGIVVEATLRLCAPPAGLVVALCAVPDEARVLELFAHVQGHGLTL